MAGHTRHALFLACTAMARQVAFGRPFISNPDLPERFANNSPLAPDADYGAYYHGGEKGYIDWPVYQDGEQAK